MTLPLSWLSDRSDPRVQAALTRTCGVCGAKPKADCTNPCSPVKGEPRPLGRVVHLERAQQHLEKKGKR